MSTEQSEIEAAIARGWQDRDGQWHDSSDEQIAARFHVGVGRVAAVREWLDTIAYETHALKPCGTHAAFVRHKNHDEDPCDECTEAERVYQYDRYRAKGRAA